MTDLQRIRCVWSGSAIVGGGVSTFYTADSTPTAATAALITYFTSAVVNMPSGATVTIPSSGEVIDSTTGEFKTTWNTGGSSTSKSGTDPGVYAAGVGLRVVWNTDGITHGRRVRGSTFLVPMGAGQYQSDGTINNTSVTNQTTYASTLVATLGGSMVIWTKAVGGAGGKISHVLNANVPDKVTWLKSRRT